MTGQQERTDGNLAKAGYAWSLSKRFLLPMKGMVASCYWRASCYWKTLLAGRYWKSPITHLEWGLSSTNMVQVGDKNGPAKAARPMGSSHAAAQGGSSCKAREAWGVPEHPSLLMGLTQSRGTLEQPLPAASRQGLSPKLNPIPLFQPQAPALHPPWHFTGSSFTTQFLSLNQQKTHPEKKPHNVSAGSDWALQRPGEHQLGHTEGLLSTNGEQGG